MSTSPRPQDSAVLGESWVVPSSPVPKNGPETPSPSPRHRSSEGNKKDGSDSLHTSASSISGPELIMPSICESPVLEASWVTPHVRKKSSPSSSPSQTLKRRHKQSHCQETSEHGTTASVSGEEQASTPDHQPDGNGNSTRSNSKWEMPVRTVVNLFLIMAIAHLLVLPELVHHYRTLCSISTIPTLYPSSCTEPHPLPPRQHQHQNANQNQNKHPTHNSVLTLQTQLEILFNSTLEEISPYADTLPETESFLHEIQTAMKRIQSGPQHELTLEFDGCRHALTTATRKLDSLKADLRSAVDSLMATSGLSPPTQDNDRRSVDIAKDARHSTQMARREKYLDQLAARMRLRTDSLTGDFAALADHLESLERVVQREAALRGGGSSSDGKDASKMYRNLRTFVDSIVPGLRIPR